jgi:hypothetical protein
VCEMRLRAGPRMRRHAGMATLRTRMRQRADAVTKLVNAAYTGNVRAMRLLLDHPSVDAPAMMMRADSDGDTALHMAAHKGNVAAMRLLLNYPSVDAPAMMMQATRTLTHTLACTHTRTHSHARTRTRAQEAEGGVHGAQRTARPPSHTSHLLLEKTQARADVYDGQALIDAAGSGHTAVMRMLLEATRHDSMALTASAALGHADVVRLLLGFHRHAPAPNAGTKLRGAGCRSHAWPRGRCARAAPVAAERAHRRRPRWHGAQRGCGARPRRHRSAAACVPCACPASRLQGLPVFS